MEIGLNDLEGWLEYETGLLELGKISDIWQPVLRRNDALQLVHEIKRLNALLCVADSYIHISENNGTQERLRRCYQEYETLKNTTQ